MLPLRADNFWLGFCARDHVDAADEAWLARRVRTGRENFSWTGASNQGVSGPARPSKATPVFGRGFLLLCFGFAVALLSACGGQGKLFELSVAPHSAPGQAACIKLLRRESPAGAELPVLRLDCRKSTKVAWYTVDLQYRGRAATWVSCSVLAYDGSGRRLWEVPHGLPLQAASNVE